MSNTSLIGWERLRHRGLLLDTPRLQRVAAHEPKPLSNFHEEQLRRSAAAIVEGKGEVSAFVSLVLEHVCGFSTFAGTWKRGSQVEGEWGRRSVTGETVKPRQLWRGHHGAVLPVFIDGETRLGLGKGRKAASQVVQWLRGGPERLAVLTNGRQWRLIFAGLDFDAWCEWDVDLWFEEGKLSPQVTALRTLLAETQWIPEREGVPSPLLQAILDSRKGQAELSAALGERVREAVELLVQSHGEALKRDCPDVDPAEIYRAAVRVVMRMVVVLFAESRELLPRDNTLYHGSYGLSGLLGELERVATRGGNRLARSFSAWPRILSLFRLVHEGSHHPALPVPAYGGDLFALGSADSADGLSRALAVFEEGAYADELLPDRDVLQLLERITRTRIRVRQGKQVVTVSAPVDFSDLSSEYIGILYEGLLDFELRTAPSGDPIVFLNVGNQPALPLSRLEQMDDKAIANLLEKMKDKGKKSDEDGGDEAAEQGDDDDDEEEDADDVAVGDEGDEVPVAASGDEGDQDEDAPAEDERHVTRTRAEQWARRAVAIGKLVNRPKGTRSAEKEQAFDDAVGRKARQLVVRVVLPGEWYLVRWGGTRKGSGTFYTRPGLAVPTVQRTLRPLAYTPPAASDGAPNVDAPAVDWTPRLPEEILAINVCDPACGSGTFPVAALRFLTDALYASLHHHQRIVAEGERSVVRLLGGATGGAKEERLSEELLPGRPDDAEFEPRLKAILRRHVVERCIYGVDLDPLAVELCRLALWVETMDRRLPFSFLDHKIKCGNGLVGAWFDQFQHYPAMAWKNREGGDKNHSNGVHFAKETRTKAIKAWVKDVLVPDLQKFLAGRTLFQEDLQEKAVTVHDEALATLAHVHALPVHDSAERSRIYREDVLGSPAYARLKESMDLWCACWFWPVDQLAVAPLPTTLASADDETRRVAARVAAKMRFFHWELEFPDVFRTSASGFDAILGNPPWDIAKPNSKEFFSNIDPLYRSYGKQEAIEFQRTYFADAGVERAWLEYNADLRAKSNAMGYLARPFGDPSVVDDAQDRFSIGKGKGSDALHASWRSARRKSKGYADPAHPYQHQGAADLNLYKLFLEQAHTLLRAGGRLGFILPSGLYSDHGTGALRRLLLDRCQWEWLFGFENREKVFAIDSRFQFNPIIVQKGGSTSAIRTAFMRRNLEDWERGEELATPYARAQVDRFSPRSKAILEIQSARDLEILEKIYSNSVLLWDTGPDGWGIKYATEFHMTNDSKLFPPRPKWEEQGYRPDEYSRWLKGDWRPIAELWPVLGVDPTQVVPIDPACEARMREPDVQRTAWRVRCAQPPYDALPIPRAGIPAGIVLSREGDAWIREEGVEDVALPLYEGRMIGQFDFSEKGWVSGKGRGAVWREIPWERKVVEPQYLIGRDVLAVAEKVALGPKIAFMPISSATNTRTAIATMVVDAPAGHSVSFYLPHNHDLRAAMAVAAMMSSLAYDYAMRQRLGGLNMSEFVMAETPLPPNSRAWRSLSVNAVRGLMIPTQAFAEAWLYLRAEDEGSQSWKALWALTPAARLRDTVKFDALVARAMGLGVGEMRALLKDCDLPVGATTDQLDVKGFWRVDRDKLPHLRHTVLTMAALAELAILVERHGGDLFVAAHEFLGRDTVSGWRLPRSGRLHGVGLGGDDGEEAFRDTSAGLGPLVYDWQLAQTPDESWRECELHAGNLQDTSGVKRYQAPEQSTSLGQQASAIAERRVRSQRELFT